MVLRWQIQTPDESLTWSNDWSDWLSGQDTIDTRQWTISPDISPSYLTDADTAIVIVSGLSWGMRYELTETVTTVNGIVGSRSIILSCEER